MRQHTNCARRTVDTLEIGAIILLENIHPTLGIGISPPGSPLGFLSSFWSTFQGKRGRGGYIGESGAGAGQVNEQRIRMCPFLGPGIVLNP